MEYHIEKAIAAIEKQIKGLRELGYTTSVSLSSEQSGLLPTIFIFLEQQLTTYQYLCLTGGFSRHQYVDFHLRQVASSNGIHLLGSEDWVNR